MGDVISSVPEIRTRSCRQHGLRCWRLTLSSTFWYYEVHVAMRLDRLWVLLPSISSNPIPGTRCFTEKREAEAIVAGKEWLRIQECLGRLGA